MSVGQIQLRGVRVHNLKGVDVALPQRRLVVFCGVSGSGKTSLALDTLYAEGRRRYIESFSAYTRQFLEQLDKPDVEHIEGIPPAIAVTYRSPSRSARATVGAVTEIDDYLRLLFARVGDVYCLDCDRPVQRDWPATAARRVGQLPERSRIMVGFDLPLREGDGQLSDMLQRLLEDGFVRVIARCKSWHLADATAIGELTAVGVEDGLRVVVDRLTISESAHQRLVDSFETAFAHGDGHCWVLCEEPWDGDLASCEVDGRRWYRREFSSSLRCGSCGTEYPNPDPRLYSFNSPLGACSQCEGFGNIVDMDMDLIVPDSSKSIREGAIAPWNTPAYRHELEELLALAPDYDLPVDVPFRELTDEHIRLIREGVPERDFGGLKGFFAWLEKRKYKMHLRVFASRWKSYYPCPQCGGARLRREALATRVGGKNLAEMVRMKITELHEFLDALELSESKGRVARMMLDQILNRLAFLQRVGVGYLTLDRTLRTLSGGEAQRVTLTTALGSSLVNMLYVLDEPSVGLHPRDVDRLIEAIAALRDRGNSVVVVEHEEAVFRAADHIVELGPGAGEHGGDIVFEGTLEQLEKDPHSVTGAFLAGRRGVSVPEQRRRPDHGWVRLVGARGNNLKNVSVDFPLGVLCLVTGVSGAGKSTLVQDTLYPAVCRRKRKESPKPAPFDDVFGDGQIDDVILIDQSPVGRSPRSNPVTYVKAFDEIRNVFAGTVDARTRNYSAGHFSFNVDGGRCPDCKGDGCVEIDTSKTR